MHRLILLLGASSVLAWALSACVGSMQRSPPQQGIYGTFTTYGPPREIQVCTSFVTQKEKDVCRKANERKVEEPLKTSIKIQNLKTGDSLVMALDGTGSYKALLQPGEYTVCVGAECSDPLSVGMGAYVTYGLRLPREEE